MADLAIRRSPATLLGLHLIGREQPHRVDALCGGAANRELKPFVTGDLEWHTRRRIHDLGHLGEDALAADRVAHVARLDSALARERDDGCLLVVEQRLVGLAWAKFDDRETQVFPPGVAGVDVELHTSPTGRRVHMFLFHGSP